MSVLQGYWPYGSFAFGLLPCFVKLKLKSAIYQALKNQLELFMPFKNIIFIAFFIVLLSGCGDSNTEAPITNELTVSGVAQLGLISGATVKLLKLPEMSLLAETTTSSDSVNYGAFSFVNVILSEQDYYLIEVSGGVDTDPNDDGIVIDEESIEVQGKVRAIVTGLQLTKNTIRVTALSDLQALFIKSDSNVYDLTDPLLLDKFTTSLIQDINEDGLTNADDLLLFNPLLHQQKLKVNYLDIINGHITNIHNNLEDDKKLYDLLTLLSPTIHIKNGVFQKTPFALSPSLSSFPSSLTAQWLLDGVVFDPLDTPEITTSGSKQVSVNLLKDGMLVKTLNAIITAYSTDLLVEQTITVDVGGVIALNDDNLHASLVGTKVIIPVGALSQQEVISINKNSALNIPNINGAISPVVTFEPSGLHFVTPVTIAIPLNEGAHIPDISKVRIARTDENGVIDYLNPLKFNDDKSLLYFETDHFSSYIIINEEIKDALVDGWGDPLLKSIVKDIEKRFPNGYQDISNSDWVSYLSTEIGAVGSGDDRSALTVFDAYQSFKTAVEVNDDIARNEKPSTVLDGPYRGYAEAFKKMYGSNVSPKGGVMEEWEFAQKMIENPISMLLEQAEKQYFTHPTLTQAYLEFKSTEDTFESASDSVESIFNNRFPIDFSQGNAISKIMSLYKESILSVGGEIVSQVSDIKINWQIERYFDFRKNDSADNMFSQLMYDGNISGWNIKSGWFSPSPYTPSGSPPDNFWQMVEAMYLHSLSVQTEQQKLKKLLDAAINLSTLKKPADSHFLQSYQVNGGAIITLDGKYDNRTIEVSAQPNESFVITFTERAVADADSDYIKNFAPEFVINSLPKKCWSCGDDLSGLTYEFNGGYNGPGGTTSTVDIEFTFPSGSQVLDYEIYFKYKESVLVDLLNGGRKFTIKRKMPNSAPIVSLSTNSDTDFTEEQPISVTALAHDDDGDEVTYSWQLLSDLDIEYSTDGGQLDFVAPIVSVSETVTVVVTVTDSGDATSSDSIDLIIHPKEDIPTVNAGVNQTVISGNPVTLKATATNSTGTYLWEKISSRVIEISDYNQQSISFTAPDVTEQTDILFKVTVIDQNGIEAFDGVIVTINPVVVGSPSVDAGADQTVHSGSQVVLNATATNSTDMYVWEKLSGPVVTVANYNTQSISFSAPETNYSVLSLSFKVTVIGLDGSQVSDVINVEVYPPSIVNTPPTVSVGEAITVQSGQQNITLTAVAADADGNIDSYLWSQTSGTPVTITNSNAVTATFDAPSVSVVTPLLFKVRVMDNDGASAHASQWVTVEPAAIVSSTGFDFPLGDRGVSNGAPTAFAEQINGEVNHTYFGEFAVTDNFTRQSVGADTSKWRNAQDVGSFLAGYGLHPGEDWNLGGGNDDAGEQVYAVANGKVIAIRSSFLSSINAGAWTIVLEHIMEDSSKVYSLYTHVTALNQTSGSIVASANDFSLSVGQNLSRGDVIGRLATGMTSISTSHLHFEIRDLAPSPTGSLWPLANNVGYYSHDGSKPSNMNTSQIDTAFVTMNSEGIIDPSDYIDFNRAGMTANVDSLSPQTAISGQLTTFIISGSNIPSSLVLSLYDANGCSAAYDVTATSAKIDCTPGATLGNTPFYAKNKSLGIFLKNTQGLTVEITQAASGLEVLGITFTDLAFAQCVQAEVTDSGATNLSDLTSLDCQNMAIINVDELSYMTGLVTLGLNNNNITTLNLDNSPDLHAVGIRNNPLSQATKDYLASITWIANLYYDETTPVTTGKLNDTGITTCSDETTNGLPCPVSGFEGQDGEYGRDANSNTNDDSDGHAGFSFTKLDSDGTPLTSEELASGKAWSCVRDNVTGFIWEVKTDDGGVRDKDNTYTWYNSTGINDGGSAGTENGGSCPDGTNCDTEKYVQAVNGTNLCGANDWRLPARATLRSIVDYSRVNPAIDSDYFPNTRSSYYWSSSASANYSGGAWIVYFGGGGDDAGGKANIIHVRLVRGGQ